VKANELSANKFGDVPDLYLDHDPHDPPDHQSIRQRTGQHKASNCQAEGKYWFIYFSTLEIKIAVIVFLNSERLY